MSSADFVHSYGLGFSVVFLDEGSNIGFELFGGGMSTTSDLLTGELGELALDLTTPMSV